MGKYNSVAFEKWLENEAEKQEKHIVIRSVCGSKNKSERQRCILM